MYNLKYGDRFWFEHKDQVASFTPGKFRMAFFSLIDEFKSKPLTQSVT